MGNALEKGSATIAADAIAQETHCTAPPAPLHARVAVVQGQPQANRGAGRRACAVTRREIARLHDQFLRLASVQSSTAYTIGPAAFAEVMALCGLDQRQTDLAARLFRVFDRDSSGAVDFREFMAGLSAMMRGTVQERLECTLAHTHTARRRTHERTDRRDGGVGAPSFLTVAFELYDVDKSGYVRRGLGGSLARWGGGGGPNLGCMRSAGGSWV
jgi:Ca2+-binding EF-hand superfamily protein